MARPLRVQFSGAWYHVMNRGASKRTVFSTPGDVADFLSLTGEASEQFSIEVHVYCVMGNHYHLLIRTPEANLGRAMRHIDGVYTQRFHLRNGTDGPLFRGRYKAILVQADRHLLQVSRYIHLNPVQAGLAEQAQAWPYSSLGAYLDPIVAPCWLHTGVILGYFGSIGARQRYRQFVQAGLDPGTRDFYGRQRIRSVLGGDEFREEILRRAGSLSEDERRELPELRSLTSRIPLATIARVVATEFEISEEALKAPHRHADKIAALARGAFVHASRRLGGFWLREVAAWLGYASYQGAAKAALRFAAAANTDPALAGRLAAAIKTLEASSGRMPLPTEGAALNGDGSVCMSRLDP